MIAGYGLLIRDIRLFVVAYDLDTEPRAALLMSETVSVVLTKYNTVFGRNA